MHLYGGIILRFDLAFLSPSGSKDAPFMVSLFGFALSLVLLVSDWQKRREKGRKGRMKGKNEHRVAPDTFPVAEAVF